MVEKYPSYEYLIDTNLALSLSKVNDSLFYSDKEREEKITSILKEHDIEVEFVGEYKYDETIARLIKDRLNE